MAKLNEKIRILRKRAGLTQKQLGKKLYLSADAVYQWERENGNTPQLEEIKLMCDLFHVPIEVLINDDCELPRTGPLEDDEFERLGNRLPKDLKLYFEDSLHEVLDAGLRRGAKLHRFTNPGGAEYSAVYIGRYELLSCDRERERDMVKYWNETGYRL